MPLLNARLTKVLIALAAVVPSALRGDEARADGGGSPLENARRDLQTLPANGGVIDHSQDPSLKFSVPSAPLTSSSESKSARPSTSQSSAASSSADWLLDAWRKAEVTSQARRAAEANRSAGVEHSTSKSKFAQENPFTPYLQQWISPRDQGLLLLKAPNDLNGPNSSQIGPRDSRGIEVVPRPLADSDSAALSTKNSEARTAPFVPNPYLPAPDTKPGNGFSGVGVSSIPPASFSSPRPAAPAPRPFSGSVPAASTATKPRKASSQVAEPGYVPPTAPIIDERKYFPQLHRF